jgi:hypothetical protein
VFGNKVRGTLAFKRATHLIYYPPRSRKR